MKEQFNFIYQGKRIPLASLKQKSTSTSKEIELIELMNELNFQHSFSKWFNMNKEELDKLDLKIEYKCNTKTLHEYREELHKLNQKLELTEKINGLELYLNNNSFSLDFNEKEYWVIKQVCRLFQDVYFTLCNARFSLTKAYNKFHPQSAVIWENGYKGQLFVRTLYTNHAIIWYRSLFDILLQTFWIAKELYIKYYERCEKGECKKCKKHSKNKEKYARYNGKVLSNEDYNIVLKDCNWINIQIINGFGENNIFKKFKVGEKFKCIDNWCNSLKHRNSIRYKGFYPEPKIVYVKNLTFARQSGKISFHQNNLNTEKELELELEDIDSVIEKLIHYHSDLLNLINDSFDELNDIFKEWGCTISKS